MNPRTSSALARCCLLLLLAPACVRYGGVDLSPAYRGESIIVPAAWQGQSPFVEAQPSDGALRKDWWKLFGEPVLDQLEEHAMQNNPDLQAAAERFVQARDEMMKARSKLVPNLGLGVDLSLDKQSDEALFRGHSSPVHDNEASLGGLASWEPDFWSRLRNKTRMHIFRAEQKAAEYALARLGIQAELATAYFALRSLDAQDAIYRQSIGYYQDSLALVMLKFKGKIAAELDVARAEFQLADSQARQFDIQARRQVTEHAIAILVNTAPALFSIAPKDALEVVHFAVPASLPSTLLQRRPDVAAMEREMAQANKAIGVARSAFFPHIPLGARGGIAGHFGSLFKVANFFWSVGSFIHLPAFEGGFRRAELQRAWSVYREMEDQYRATLLNAFREVEDGLSLTTLIAAEDDKQKSAVAAAWKQQDLSAMLYRGGLASSLDLINAQVNTLDSRLRAVDVKLDLLRSTVGLIRSLGGGWRRADLPEDDEIQPFGVFQYANLTKPVPVGGIDVAADPNARIADVTSPIRF